MKLIELNYTQEVNRPSDINEHLQVLRELGQECDHITEFGVRNVVSTWAFLAAKPKKLISYDIEKHPNISTAYLAAEEAGLNFSFVHADVLKIEIEQTDLLFIDTLHIYSQLRRELELHSSKAKKYIVLHDTSTYAYKPEPSEWQTPAIMQNYVTDDMGIWPAIEEFLSLNPSWSLHKRFYNNNGLTVLKRSGL